MILHVLDPMYSLPRVTNHSFCLNSILRYLYELQLHETDETRAIISMIYAFN